MIVTIVWSMWHDDPELSAAMTLQGREPVTQAIITLPSCFTAPDEEVLAALFEQTNLYEGPLWDRIERVLPDNRSHTALSVGDHVVIDDRSYRCARIGWERAERPATTRTVNTKETA